MPPSSAPASSPSIQTEKPSSLRLRAVRHDDEIVRAKGAPRKCGSRNWIHVQHTLETITDFGKRVEYLLGVLGLSYDEAAEQWGFSRTQIIAWAKGRQETKWSNWDAIERAAIESLRRTGS